MTFLLRMKAGWLFLLIMLPIVFQFVALFTGLASSMAEESGDKDQLLFDAIVLMILSVGSAIISMILIFGWMYTVGTSLHPKLPADHNLKLGRFKFAFFFPLFYVIGVMLFIFTGPTAAAAIFGWFYVIFPVHILAMVCMLYVLRYVAKSLKSVELQRKVRFGDYAGEFFLVWFYIIGVWIIQPRINTIFAEEKNVYGGPVDRYLK